MGYKRECKKDYEIFEAGNVVLQSGLTLRGAKLAYQAYGTFNADQSNVILIMKPFGDRHMDIEGQVGPSRTLDPERYFIVVPNQFGNGMSSSPSNSVAPTTVAHWPRFTVADNVRIQRRLMKKTFGIDRLKLACDWLMRGMQTNHWAERFPQRVEHLAVIGGAARISDQNHIFLESVKAMLTADARYQDGYFTGFPERGHRAMDRVCAGWALSQAFYREELWRQTGYFSLKEYWVMNWEGNFLRRDANNLLAQIWT